MSPKTTLEHINFLYEGLKIFYPALFYDPHDALRQPVVYSYKGVPKTKFLKYTLELTDTNSVEEAVKVLLHWRELLEKEEITETVPAEIGEMVEKLENYEKLTEQEKQSLDEQLSLLKQKLASEKRIPKPPELTKESVPSSQVSEEAAKGLKIAISPRTAKGLSSSAARVLFAPLNFIIKAGGRTSQVEGTAASLALSFGISSSTLSSAIKKRPDLSGDSLKRLEKLVELIKNIETGSPVFAALARRAYGAGNVQLILDIQEIGIPQALIYNLTPRADTFSFPQTFFAPKGIFGSIGRRVLGKASSRVLGRIVGKKAVATVAKVTGKKLLSKIATAIGGAIGNIPGAIIGWIGSEVITRLGSWLKRHKEVAFGIVGGIAGFIVAGMPGLIIGGALGLGAAMVIAQGAQAATAQIGGAIQAGLVGITSIVLPSIGVPFVIALISIPIIIAIILFIINSGAYIVPPSVSLVSESPYIKVEKRANPGGPFENSVLNKPLVVEYTVTITAKKGALENIRLDYECEVIKKEGVASCPPIKPDMPKPENEGYPKRISPLESYSFSYSAKYDSLKYSDAAIIDTITVTADVAEKKDAKSAGSAAIIIGDAPTGCFVFEGEWPAGARAREMAAIAKIAKAQTFMAQLCSQGEIKLDHEPQVARWGGWTKGYRYIVIYPLGVYTHASAVYTLAHESGHVLAQVTSLYNKYIDTPGLSSERPLCTYPLSIHPPSEDFAEMIALYLSRDVGQATSRFSCLGPGKFKIKYPNHWGFARNSIFLENLGW